MYRTTHDVAIHDVAAVIVQAGWRLYTRDGEDLGEVISATQQHIVVAHDGEHWQFATDLLREQQERELRATLDVSAVQAERVAERVGY
jgi:hypothetical protein